MMTVVRPLQRPLHREAGGASVSGNVEAWHNRGGASGSGGFCGQVTSERGGAVHQTTSGKAMAVRRVWMRRLGQAAARLGASDHFLKCQRGEDRQ
jgi:hypothetical protein